MIYIYIYRPFITTIYLTIYTYTKKGGDCFLFAFSDITRGKYFIKNIYYFIKTELVHHLFSRRIRVIIDSAEGEKCLQKILLLRDKKKEKPVRQCRVRGAAQCGGGA